MNLARRERLALCDLALQLGPEAPTLCDGWAARELLAHLLVRERSPLGAPGIAIAPLSGLTDKAMAAEARRPFPAMVERLRSIGLTPYRLPGIEWLANTVEYVVHHEDLRRGQADWEPRTLARADEDTLWRQLGLIGTMAARQAGIPLVVQRADDPTSSKVLLKGDSPVTVTGPPSELILMLSGRHQLRNLEYDGPPERVAELKGAY